MKKRNRIGGLFFALATGLTFLAGSAPCAAEPANILQIELLQRIRTNSAGLILDVRSPEEYAEGHILGAINIPHDRLGARLNEIGAHWDKEVVLYCWSGRRVITAAGILRAAGFTTLRHLAGDMSGWQSNGNLPVAK